MSDVTKLLDKLAQVTQQHNNEMLDQAQIEVERITAFYCKQCDVIKQQISDEAVIKCESIFRRATSQGDIGLRNQILSVRRELVNQAFALAEKAFCQQNHQILVDYFTNLVCRAQTQDGELIMNAEDGKNWGDLLVQQINQQQKNKCLQVVLSKEHHLSQGGVILKQGDIDVNCTVEVLVESQMSSLEKTVATILFDGEDV